MSITGVNNNSVSNLYQYYTSESDSTSSLDSILDSLTDSDSASTSTDSTDSVLFSSQSQIYCRLQQLQKSDPDQFKETCSEIAEKLTQSAKKAGGSGSAELAIKFAAAATSGSMDDLVSTTSSTSTTTGTSSSSTSSLSDYLTKYYSQVSSSSQSSDDSSSSLILEILSKYGISV